MGLFDKWVAVFKGATGAHNVQPKKYYDTDEAQFLADIPEGQAFFGVTADRFTQVGQKNIPFFERILDMFRRGIQSVSNSYWQHAIMGIKLNGVVWIAESLNEITVSKIDVYFEEKNQLKLFFPPIGNEKSIDVWNRAKSRQGEKYDYLEILDKFSIGSKLGIRYGDKIKTICHEFARWAFAPHWDVFDPELPYFDSNPGSIDKWEPNRKKCKIMVYNLDPNIHN